MKWMDVEARWPDLQQRARRHWFHLTQGDVERITGTREELMARVQERYEFTREQAEKEVDAWVFFLTAPDVTPSEVTTAPHDFQHQHMSHDDMSDEEASEAPTVPDDHHAPSMMPDARPEVA